MALVSWKEVCEFMLCAFHFTQFSHDTRDAITRYVLGVFPFCVGASTQQHINPGLSFSENRTSFKKLPEGFSLRDCRARPNRAACGYGGALQLNEHISSHSEYFPGTDGVKKSEFGIPRSPPNSRRQHLYYAFKFSLLPLKEIDNFSSQSLVCLRFEFQFLFTLNSSLIKRYLLSAFISQITREEKILHCSSEGGIHIVFRCINRVLLLNVKKLQFIRKLSRHKYFFLGTTRSHETNKQKK